jgi:hypothetical protein
VSLSNALQRRAHIGRWVKQKQKSRGEVIDYTLDGISIHTVTTKIQASFLTETAQGFHHEANGDFKIVAEFNG